MMSLAIFKRNSFRLHTIFGIRGRIVLLALILVVPLMLERARTLEETRARQTSQALAEFSALVQRAADSQREVIDSDQTMMKSAAYIRASVGDIGQSCTILHASLPKELPWIRSLSIASRDGMVRCSTFLPLVGRGLGDRDYFLQAEANGGFVFSDYLLAKTTGLPIMMVAYPVSALDRSQDAVIVAGINLDWLSRILNTVGDRPGISAAMIDRAGIIVAASEDRSRLIGHPVAEIPVLSTIAANSGALRESKGSLSFVADDGTTYRAQFAPVNETGSRLIFSMNEDLMTADIRRDIRNAYLQIALICALLLIGALFAAERLINQPIGALASVVRRFGKGDWSARATQNGLPAEFVPLAKAFDAMAGQLAKREGDLLDANDRLTVMASIDMLSGLANRRGIQSRLDFEWMKALQDDSELSLMMIDVDYFKLFNDTYGHPEGDACLARLGEMLAGVASESSGFAGRYGGEEFCLLLPRISREGALEIARTVRERVLQLAIPHATSRYQMVTVSIGVASVTADVSRHTRDMVEAADAALYAAKRRGRNAVAEHGTLSLTAEPRGSTKSIALAS